MPTKLTRASKGTKGKAGKQKKPKVSRFFIDCSVPAKDKVLDPASFEKFLHDKVKVQGKAGNLGSDVNISRDNTRINVSAKSGTVAKRYLKYLTKKYLKQQNVRDYMHVVASAKNGYQLRYFSIADESAAADE